VGTSASCKTSLIETPTKKEESKTKEK